MARRWSVPFISTLVALLALVLVAPQSDPAEGAIPNKAGVYSACLAKKTGAIRVINYPKKKCSSGQRLIKWNAQGQMGAQGPQGAQGPAGPADWNAIGNKPAGFADGVDDVGPSYVSKIVHTTGFGYPCVCQGNVGLTFPRNEDYVFSVIPTDVGGKVRLDDTTVLYQADGTTLYTLLVSTFDPTPSGFKIRATVFADGVAPATLKRSLKAVEVKVGKVRMAPKKRR